jgi:putative ABC transport system substrate-binding protein
LNVDVIASNSTEAILAIRDLNNTTPVVMTAISDPIGNRLVASFARPGGNITGVTLFSTELAGKRLELLKEVVPQLARVGLLVERDHPPTATFVTETQAVAQPLNLALQIFEVHPEEIPEGFRSIEKEHPDALIVQQTASFTSHAREIADLAINLHLPTVSEMREFIEVGGLLAYGPSVYALGERAAWYVDRILKGTRPAELPVEQPTKFELIVNLRTAKTLGLTIPGTMLARLGGTPDFLAGIVAAKGKTFVHSSFDLTLFVKGTRRLAQHGFVWPQNKTRTHCYHFATQLGSMGCMDRKRAGRLDEIP